MHREAWQDSYTSLSPLSVQTVICLERYRRLKTTSVTSWQIIYLLVRLLVTHTHCHCTDLFCFYFLRQFACCSCWLIHQAKGKELLHWSLPNMLFALQANKSLCTPWQILVDTFKAIIWMIFYRATWCVLMERCRNTAWNRAVGGCWHRQTFRRASLVLLHKVLTHSSWHCGNCKPTLRNRNIEKSNAGWNRSGVTDCVAASYLKHAHTNTDTNCLHAHAASKTRERKGMHVGIINHSCEAVQQ